MVRADKHARGRSLIYSKLIEQRRYRKDAAIQSHFYLDIHFVIVSVSYLAGPTGMQASIQKSTLELQHG